MAGIISLGIEINDSNFQSALKSIDSEIKAMNEGVTAATKEISALGDSEDKTAQRTELYTKLLDAQNQKLNVLKSEYEKASAKLDTLADALKKAQESNDPVAIAKATNAYIEQSTTVAKLETQMNKTRGQIADTTKAMDSAGESTEKTSEDVSTLAKKLDLELAQQGLTKAKDLLESFASKLVDTGKAIWQAGSDASVFADDLATLSTQTGISTQRLQEYGYASRFIDTEVSVITGSMTKLTKNMTSTSESVVNAFKQLNVSATDSSGQLRDNQVVFFELIDALGKVSNETERDALAMTLFGKSAQQLNPLIEAGSAAWNQLADEAHNAGLIVSDEGVSALGAFNDQLQRVDATMEAAKNQIMSAVAPAFTAIADAVANAAQEFTKWVQTDEAQAMLANIAQIVMQLVTELTANLQPIIETIIGAFKLLADGIQFVIQNFDGLKIALGVIGAAIVALNIASFAASIAALCNPIGAVVVAIGVAVTAVVAMATAVAQNFDAIKKTVSDAWDGIKQKWDAAKKFFDDIWAGIANTFANVGTWFNEKFQAAYNAVTGVWDKAGQFFSDTWDTIKSVFDVAQLFQIGKDLVSGLWEGIKSMGASLFEWVRNWVDENIVGSIKEFFGIKSPSKLMRDEIGKNIGLGVAEGIMDSRNVVANAYKALIPPANLTSSADPYSVQTALGGSSVMLDNRPIILKLNDREFGRAVRGYV